MIYRYLTQLLMSGKFQDCLGIIIGECTNCLVSYGTTYEDLINDLLVPKKTTDDQPYYRSWLL